MVGENVSLLMPAPYKDEHDGYLARYLHTGVPRVIGIGREAVGRRRDGSTFPMELSVSEFQQGNHRYFTGIVRDITERKRYEAKLQDSFSESQRARKRLQAQKIELEYQANELSKAQLAADAANRAKSDFLANMSHEIRTPMTAILGFSELLEGSLLDPADREAVEIIHRNGEHLLEIINDILDISKIESGNFEVLHEWCNPLEIVEDVISLLSVKAAQKGITLTSDVIPPLPTTLQSDTLRLRQVLLNLVSNAIKFTDIGAVKVRVWQDDFADQQSSLKIQISDTGIGITESQLEHLFKPFSQGDTSVTRRYGGTGLGLALSQHLVKLLGGQIHVQSRAGAGSSFTISFPIDPLVSPDTSQLVQAVRATTPIPVNQVATTADPITARVLFAEDGEDNRRLVSYLLSKRGVTVDMAVHGRDAVEMVSRAIEAGQPYDLILMDMQMPVMDGYEATRLLRARGYCGPIVALTAHAMSGDREKCLAAGCDDYLTKPISKSDFFPKIELLLSVRETPAALIAKTDNSGTDS